MDERHHLLLLRHGQAASGRPDIKRSLTERGRRDAQLIGRWICSQGLQPDGVIASAAQRTTETAQLCCSAAGVDTGIIRYERSLYQADCDGWLAELVGLPDEVTTALWIGHNPTLSWLASRLGGRSLMLSTANLVHLTVDGGGWHGAMQFQQVIEPKRLLL